MNRLISAARIQLHTWRSTVFLPWVVLVLSFAVNLITLVTDKDPGQGRSMGGLVALYVFVAIAFSAASREYFPITLGLSGTRRTFYGASALVAVVESLVYGVAVFALAGLESATGGWGLGMSFFDLPFLRGQSPVVHLLGYAVPLLLAAFLGLWVGSIFSRWGRAGTYAFIIGVVVLGGVLHALASTAGVWNDIGQWFVNEPVPALLIGWPLLITAVLAGATWFTLQRARA